MKRQDLIDTCFQRERPWALTPLCPKPEDKIDTREAQVCTSIQPAPAGHKKCHSTAETSSPTHGEDMNSILHTSEPTPPYTQAREKRSPCRGERNDSLAELETATRGKAQTPEGRVGIVKEKRDTPRGAIYSHNHSPDIKEKEKAPH